MGNHREKQSLLKQLGYACRHLEEHHLEAAASCVRRAQILVLQSDDMCTSEKGRSRGTKPITDTRAAADGRAGLENDVLAPSPSAMLLETPNTHGYNSCDGQKISIFDCLARDCLHQAERVLGALLTWEEKEVKPFAWNPKAPCWPPGQTITEISPVNEVPAEARQEGEEETPTEEGKEAIPKETKLEAPKEMKEERLTITEEPMEVEPTAAPQESKDTEKKRVPVAAEDVLEKKLQDLLPTLPFKELSTSFVQAQLEDVMRRPRGKFDKFRDVIERVWRRYRDEVVQETSYYDNAFELDEDDTSQTWEAYEDDDSQIGNGHVDQNDDNLPSHYEEDTKIQHALRQEGLIPQGNPICPTCRRGTVVCAHVLAQPCTDCGASLSRDPLSHHIFGREHVACYKCNGDWCWPCFSRRLHRSCAMAEGSRCSN